MARDNYSYQKYRREQAKKKKKEEKMQRKLGKKNAQSAESPGQVPNENSAVSPVGEEQGPSAGSRSYPE